MGSRVRRWPWIVLGVVIAVLLLLWAALSLAMTPILPEGGEPPRFASGRFEHDLWDKVLGRFVDASGRVDYQALKQDPGDLEKYYRAVASYSPDSHPDMFPDRDARLCYWINAYNAAVIKTVLRYYPITSVSEVKPIWYLAFMPKNSGFFLFQEPVFGGRPLPLYDLEHRIILDRFQEPRVHFALNCASVGCPRLPRRAFRPETLQEDLESEAQKFFAERRNLRVDHKARKIHLSSLMQWYAEDFPVSWSVAPDFQHATMLYVWELLPGRQTELQNVKDYAVEFIPYDWSLNDQHTGR